MKTKNDPLSALDWNFVYIWIKFFSLSGAPLPAPKVSFPFSCLWNHEVDVHGLPGAFVQVSELGLGHSEEQNGLPPADSATPTRFLRRQREVLVHKVVPRRPGARRTVMRGVKVCACFAPFVNLMYMK